MNKTFLNPNTYDPTLHGRGEINLSPTMTVPDQSLTIPQILDMFTRGVDIENIYKNGVGYEDPDFDDLDPTQDPAFDLVQAKQMLEETKAKIKHRQTTIDEAIEAKKREDGSSDPTTVG